MDHERIRFGAALVQGNTALSEQEALLRTGSGTADSYLGRQKASPESHILGKVGVFQVVTKDPICISLPL